MSRSSAAVKKRPEPQRARRDGGSAKPRRVRLQAVDAPRTFSLGLLTLFAIVTLFGALLIAAVVQTAVVQNQVESDKLGQQIEQQKLLQAKLSLEVARLESPDRILDAARDNLGMVSPDNRPYLAPVVPDDPDVAVPAPGESPFQGTNP